MIATLQNAFIALLLAVVLGLFSQVPAQAASLIDTAVPCPMPQQQAR